MVKIEDLLDDMLIWYEKSQEEEQGEQKRRRKEGIYICTQSVSLALCRQHREAV
jgi:hypothetical protein